MQEQFGQDSTWEMSITANVLRITNLPNGCGGGEPEDHDYDLTTFNQNSLRVAINNTPNLACIKVGGFNSTPAVELTTITKLCPDPYTVAQSAFIDGPI